MFFVAEYFELNALRANLKISDTDFIDDTAQSVAIRVIRVQKWKFLYRWVLGAPLMNVTVGINHISLKEQ